MADAGGGQRTRRGVWRPVAEKKQRVSRKQDVPVESAPRNSTPPAVIEARRNYAPRGIAGLLGPVVRPAFRKRAPAAAQLLADWPQLAGPDLAARAAPVKFAGGTLTLACTGPVAMELQLLAPQIMSRLNLSLGHAMIERLRFVQQAPSIDAPKAPPMHAAPIKIPENLPDGPLGEALASLYKGMKSRK
jgi:hypothetical protein